MKEFDFKIDKELPNVIEQGIIYVSDTQISFICPCGCGLQVIRDKPFDVSQLKDEHYE